MKSEKLASLRSASDTRISGRVLATRLSGRLGTDAVPPDAQWSTDGLTDKKWVCLKTIESSARYALGRMQYAPTLTNQKLNSLSSIESSARYVQRRIQYAPTLTDQKLDFLLSIESKTRNVLGRMLLRPTHTDKKLGGLLTDDSQTGYALGRMLLRPTHTDQKLDFSLSIDFSTRYALGRMQYTPTLTVDCMGSFCQPSDLDAPSNVPEKGTEVGTRLFRRVIYWGRPGPTLRLTWGGG